MKNFAFLMARRALLALVVVSLPLAALALEKSAAQDKPAAQDRSAAQDKSAETFLRSIYGKPYIGKNAKGLDIDTRAQLDRYFTPDLAKRMDDDAKTAAKNGDVGELDGDAFIGAQDMEIAAFDVSVQPTDATHATGTVRFKNLGDARTVIVTLVKLKPGWRIADIDWGGDAGKLSSLFAAKK